MITHGKKCHYLAAKSFSALLRGITLKHYVEMPEKDNKILKKNHGENSMKVLFIIYADLDVCLKKCIHVIIILKNHQRAKIYMHTPSGYSLFTSCSFEKKIKKSATKIINYEKKRNDTAN